MSWGKCSFLLYLSCVELISFLLLVFERIDQWKHLDSADCMCTCMYNKEPFRLYIPSWMSFGSLGLLRNPFHTSYINFYTFILFTYFLMSVYCSDYSWFVKFSSLFFFFVKFTDHFKEPAFEFTNFLYFFISYFLFLLFPSIYLGLIYSS